MNNAWVGFLLGIALVAITLFIFRDDVHIGRITNGTDSTLTIKVESVYVALPQIQWRNKPAHIDTVYLGINGEQQQVRAVLDTTLHTGDYTDRLHISYIEGAHVWDDIYLLLEPRETLSFDSTWVIKNTQTVYETNWTLTGIIGIILLIIGHLI